MRGVAPFRGLKISYRVVRLGYLNLVRIRTPFFELTSFELTFFQSIKQGRPLARCHSMGTPIGWKSRRPETVSRRITFSLNGIGRNKPFANFFPIVFRRPKKFGQWKKGRKTTFCSFFCFNLLYASAHF